jgi:diguanylate cyclase (GGDEF)-like protein
LSGEGISSEDLTLHVYTPKEGKSLLSPTSFLTQWTLPLRLAGKPLGILSVFPKNGEEFEEKKRELMSTVSNILAISLKNAQEYHRVKEMAVTDGMTGVFNYKGFQEFMKREFQRAKRYKKPLSLIMIDVDGFKAINDSLGHQAGDYVLRELASCLKGSVRNSDIVARYGGDEFVILLPETDLKEAEVLIRRMSSTIKDHPFQWKSKRINIEISYGISSVSELGNGRGENELIRRADSRLYSLKLSTIKAFMTQ